MEGVLYVFPDATLVPPVAAVNQLTVPVLDEAPNKTEPSPQREPGVEEAIVGEALIVTEVVVE